MSARVKEVSFDVPPDDAALIAKIAVRAQRIARENGVSKYSRLQASMDITATHANGTPLKLAELFAADDFSFEHDIFGIRRHLNRITGQLENHFLPRFARPEKAGVL